MAVFNSLTFDGENSLDYGVYITGEAVYNAPERAVEMISIPGRNGAIALDQGRFENIEVTYPAGTFGDDQPEFASKIRAFRNALASRFKYVKLTDSYHPDEYRLGLYKSGLTTTPVQRSKAGEFPIVFNCKPQRFLTSGETEVDGNAWSNVQTGSGSIVTINNADGDIGFKSLVANIEPIQNFNGYDKPWAGGAGKNLLHVTATTQTVNGITFTFNNDGSIKLNGTSTADNTFINLNYTAGKFEYPTDTSLKIIGGNSKVAVSVVGTASPVRIANSTSTTSPTTFTIASSRNDTATWARLYIQTNGTSFSNETIYPMVMLASVTDYSYEPYENICPISGWDSVKVAKTGKNLLPYPYTDSGATLNGVTYSVSADGKIKLSGTATANLYIRLYGGFATDATLKKPVPHWLQAGTSYTLSGGQSASVRLQVDFYNGTASAGEFTDTGSGRAFTPTETQINDADSFAVFLRIANGTTVDSTISPMIRFSSESAEWEPFGTTKDIPLGRTVYKGTLDVATGLLTVTHLGVDMGSLSWTAMAGQGGSIYYMRTTDLASTIYRVASSDVVADLYSDAYVAKKNNTIYAGVVGVASTASGYVTVYDDRYNTSSSASAFKTAVTGQTLVYPLATPLTYQLTPEEVDLLLGTNNIWADSGDITVQYGNSPVYNPTEFDARPLIKVTGTGTAVVGDTAITITGTAGQTIYIDCDSMEIYKLNGGAPQSAASLVSFSGNDFPKLKAGSNTVALGTGITSVTITPRWWII